MSLKELFKEPTVYKKAGRDEWDEIYESITYFYDEETDKILSKKIYGRDNARNSRANYEKIDEREIKESELPEEALAVLKKLRLH